MAVSGWNDDDRLPSSIISVARAAAAQGADRMAVVLAYEAARLCRIRSRAALDGDGFVELEHLGRLAAEGGPLPVGAAKEAIDAAAAVIGAAPAPPPSG